MVGESGSQSSTSQETYKTRGVVFQRNERNCCYIKTNDRRDIHQIISQQLWRSPENHLDHHLWTWVQKCVEGTFQNNILINKDNCSTKFGVLTTNNVWLIVGAAFSNTEKSSFILTRTFSNDATRHSSIHSSIYSLLHSLHWTSEISVQRSLSEIHSSIHSSNTPEDQLIETLFPNVYSPILPEDPFNSSSLFRPSIHRSILDHLSRRPFIHLSRRPFIDPSRRRTHRSIQTTHSFLSWSDQHAFQSSLQMNHRQSRVRLHFEESTDTKVELNNIIFYNTKKM